MAEGAQPRARELAAVEDRGVVAGVGDHGVGGAQDRRQAAEVGLVAGREDQRVLGAHPVRDLLLELAVQRDRAVHQARAGERRCRSARARRARPPSRAGRRSGRGSCWSRASAARGPPSSRPGRPRTRPAGSRGAGLLARANSISSRRSWSRAFSKRSSGTGLVGGSRAFALALPRVSGRGQAGRLEARPDALHQAAVAALS